MRYNRPFLALLALSAALQTVIFPVAGPLPVWRAQLAWVALVPWFLVLLRVPKLTSRPVRDATLLSYSCGALWNLGHCYWIFETMHQYGHMSVGIAGFILLLYCLYLGLYHAAFGFAAAIFLRSRSVALHRAVPLVFALLWVTLELGRARITSVPWDLLGYSQVDNIALDRLAPWGGTYAISFLVVLVNALIAQNLFQDASRPPLYARSGWIHRVLPPLGIGIALLCILLGVLTHAPVSPAEETALLVQPNLNADSDDRPTIAAPSLENELASLTRSAMQQAREQGSVPHLILWPEAPAPYEVHEPLFQATLTDLAAQQNSTVIADTNAVDPNNNVPRHYNLYNSAALFTAQGLHARYDKIHLVPFGEFVPYADLFSFASGLTQQVGTFDRGRFRIPLSDGTHRYGTFICYESIFGDEVRQLVLHGADVLVNLSDDGWYGDTSAPFQHMNMARMRAIENRRWLLRDTNNGITSSIDPYGVIREAIPRHQRLAAAMHYGYTSELTFYTRHGDWFAYLCTLLTLAALGLVLLHRPANAAAVN